LKGRLLLSSTVLPLLAQGVELCFEPGGACFELSRTPLQFRGTPLKLGRALLGPLLLG
jgi:hypothetical protein